MNEDFKKELERLSPDLAKLKSQQSVEKPELPANFFHNMQVEVLEKLKEELQPANQTKKVKPQFVWWNFLFKPQVSIAFATAVILITGGIFWMQNPMVEKPVFAELSEEEILEYIDDNIEDFDAVSLTEIANEEFDLENDLEDEEINQYLEENIDLMDETDFENLF